MLGVLIVVAVALAMALPILLLTDSDFGAPDEATRAATKPLRELIEKRFLTVISVVMAWPSWALVLKRLHDIGQGWMTFLPVVALDVATMVLDVLDKDDVSNQMLLVYLGVIAMLAVIKGASGANEYGPDPLQATDTSRRRAAA